MAAPIVSSDQDIHDRLVSLLDDSPKTPDNPENDQDTKGDEPEGDEPEVELKDDDTQEGEEGEGEGEGEEAPKVELKEDEPEGEEEPIKTLTDLAKMFEVDEAELLNHLEVDTGSGQSVSLAKVISTYKNAPEAIHKYEEFKAERETFAQEAAQLRASTDAAVKDLAAHAQALLDVTNEEFKDVNWKELEAEDPQSYLILKNKQAERGALIRGAIDKLRAVEQERSADMQNQSVKHRQAEISALHAKMPEWGDREVAQQAMRETHEYLLAAGYSEEMINGIIDHRHLLTAWEAAQYRKLKQQAPKKLQKLRGLPKPKNVLRSGARRDASRDTRKKAQAKFDRLKKTGDERDAAKLLEEIL